MARSRSATSGLVHRADPLGDAAGAPRPWLGTSSARSLPPAALLAIAVLASACGRQGTSTSTVAPQPIISDAGHNGGTPGFYFLPPMVTRPAAFGTLAASAQPIVQIDQVTLSPPGCSSDCTATVVKPAVARFTRTSGADGRRIKLHLADATGDDDDPRDGDDEVPVGYFVATWDSDDFGVALHGFYRVRVLIPSNGGELELGYADVEIVANQKEVRKVDRSEYVPLIDGRTLKIKFRIDTPALACVDVTCAPLDGCHRAGACDPRLGKCTNPPREKGASCADDGNPCTVDVCDGVGGCVHLPGNAGAACRASAGACDVAEYCDGANADCPPDLKSGGLCRAATGPCDVTEFCDGVGNDCPPDRTVANGTPCDDGNACTRTDTCQAGVCQGGDPITCVASDQCHGAGSCDPSTGTCFAPVLPDGTACNDGDACTSTDTCLAGVCTGTNPVLCPSSDPCQVAGACDPVNGACSSRPAPDGTACSGGPACGSGGTCLPGRCVSGGCVVPTVAVAGGAWSRTAPARVTGAGFTPGASVLVYLDQALWCGGVADPTGGFALECGEATLDPTLLLHLPDGTHTVTAADVPGRLAWTSIGVYGPRLSIQSSTTPVGAGASVTIVGERFARQPLELWVAGTLLGAAPPVPPATGTFTSAPFHMGDESLGLIPTQSIAVMTRYPLPLPGGGALFEQIATTFDFAELGFTVAPPAAAPGELVQVSAHGLVPGLPFELRFGADRMRSKQVSADWDGRLVATYAVPEAGGALYAAPYAGTAQTLTLTGMNGQPIALSAPLDVIGPAQAPSVTVTPSTAGYWATTYTVRGAGFHPGAMWVATFGDGALLSDGGGASGFVDPDGSVFATLPLPEDYWRAFGPRTVQVEAGDGGTGSERASARVEISRPGVTIEPSSAPLGAIVRVRPHGVNPALFVSGALDDVPIGIFDPLLGGTFAVPRTIRPGMTHTVLISDGNATALGAAPLFVPPPTISAQPAFGSPGTPGELRGSGFAPGRAVSVWIDTLSLGTVAVADDGTFVTPFVAPPFAPGTHTFLVSSADGVEKAIAAFQLR